MSELAPLLIGAGIALVSGLIGAWVQHFLSLRADRIKRERDRQEREVEEIRKLLSDGARLELNGVMDELEKLRVTGAGDTTSIISAVRAIEALKEELKEEKSLAEPEEVQNSHEEGQDETAE